MTELHIVRKVQRADKSGYDTVPEAEYQRRAHRLELEGADGYEEEDMIVYWYVRKVND